jgi:regulator of sigma E protease
LLTTLLSFAFVLGVLVFVHELGHFVAAKRVGIRVLKFQLGFNPTILGFRYGDTDTEYSIGALPLGGYVKMAGESPDEARTGRPDEFLSKTKWERFQVLIMGPSMNLLLAFALTAVVLYQGVEMFAYRDQLPVVGVIAAGSPAAAADFRTGDRIVSVEGRPVNTWDQFLREVAGRSNQDVSIGLLRNGQDLTRQVSTVTAGYTRFESGDIGLLPNVHPRLLSVNAGQAGDRGGLKPGDSVLAVNGQPITFQFQLRQAIERHADQPMTITVLRDKARLDLSVTPARSGSVGKLGIGIGDETRSVQPTALEAVGMSFRSNVEFAGVILRTLWGLVTREISFKQLMGPVAIAQLSGESAQLGWVALLSLMASISLNLGLINLLPIPVLDGGHILIMALEGVARRDFSIQVKEKMLLAGFVVLMMLMVTVIYNDLTRINWIERLMPWR